MTDEGPREPKGSRWPPDAPATAEPNEPDDVAAHAAPSHTASADEPLLPPSADLAAAVGMAPPRARSEPAPSRFDDDDLPLPRRRSRRAMLLGGGALVLGLTIVLFAFLGHTNAQRYLLVCATDHVGAERGRAFPPWGSRTLDGAEWRTIALPPNGECRPRETDNRDELGGWYLEILIDRASTTLTSPTVLEPATQLDVAAAQLDQALLLARAPERRDQRKEIERLLGDVAYWRAQLRVKTATDELAKAAKQLDDAAAARPRHVSDAAGWASFARRIVDELKAGPNAAPGDAHIAAPPGTALPVEPAPTEPAGSATAPAADAGVPAGGVLL